VQPYIITIWMGMRSMRTVSRPRAFDGDQTRFRLCNTSFARISVLIYAGDGTPLSRIPLNGPALVLHAQRGNRDARQFLNMRLTLSILEGQSACGAVTGKRLLLTAKFGKEVATRQLKQGIFGVLLDERGEDRERFFILLIVTMQVQREIEARDV
jgi:hypothetical protein